MRVGVFSEHSVDSNLDLLLQQHEQDVTG